MSKKKNKKTNYNKQNTQKKTKHKLSTWFKVILIAIACICLGIDSWALYIHFSAPNKVVSQTHEVGLQETESGDKKYFAEILYNSNKNGNGLESYEIKFNYFLDENRTDFFSQGLQFVADSPEDKINWVYDYNGAKKDNETFKKEGGWYTIKNYIAALSSMGVEKGASIYNYQSHDNYDTTVFSTDPIDSNSLFKIQLGEDIFAMKFRLRNKENLKDLSELPFFGEEKQGYQFRGLWGYEDYINYYAQLDAYYFAYLLYNSIQPLKMGTNQTIVFEFGDLFDYYKYEGEDFQKDPFKESEKIIHLIKNYYVIKVTINADGVQNAQTDSLFKMVHGKANYNTTGDFTGDDYFIGRTVIDCNINAFEVIVAEDKESFQLKLNQQFINDWLEYKDIIVLKVVVDFAELEEKYVKFNGYTENAFSVFKVYDSALKNELGVAA